MVPDDQLNRLSEFGRSYFEITLTFFHTFINRGKTEKFVKNRFSRHLILFFDVTQKGKIL